MSAPITVLTLRPIAVGPPTISSLLFRLTTVVLVILRPMPLVFRARPNALAVFVFIATLLEMPISSFLVVSATFPSTLLLAFFKSIEVVELMMTVVAVFLVCATVEASVLPMTPSAFVLPSMALVYRLVPLLVLSRIMVLVPATLSVFAVAPVPLRTRAFAFVRVRSEPFRIRVPNISLAPPQPMPHRVVSLALVEFAPFFRTVLLLKMEPFLFAV